MRIIINEIKKIFNIKMVFIFILGSLFLYDLFPRFHIEVFPNGNPDTESYNIAVQMVNDYGYEMDEDEFEDFKNIYENTFKEVEKFLSNNKEFNELGVYSYEDYVNANSKEAFRSNKEFQDFYWKILRYKDGEIFWKLNSYEYFIDYYENKEGHGRTEKAQIERMNEIIANNDYQSVLDNVIFDNYNWLIKSFSTVIIVGVAFMLTPLFIKDKRAKVEALQYTSKHGRKMFKSKVAAGFISAFIIATIELIICFVLYKGNNTSMFFGASINSVFNNYFWFDLTFIQYIILTVVVIYISTMVVAAITMFISSKASNYIVGIGIQVPTVFILSSFIKEKLIHNIGIIYVSKYTVPIAYLILIIVASFMIIKITKKEFVRDILN